MTLGTFFGSIKTGFVGACVGIGNAIVNANVTHLLKGAFFVGASIYIGYVLIARHKKHTTDFENHKDETVVDRSLCMNFDDPDEFDKLSPMMKQSVTLNKQMEKLRKSNEDLQKYNEIYQKKRPGYRKLKQEDLDRITDEVEKIIFPGGKIEVSDSWEENHKDLLDTAARNLRYYNKLQREDSWKDQSEDRFQLVRLLDMPGV